MARRKSFFENSSLFFSHPSCKSSIIILAIHNNILQRKHKTPLDETFLPWVENSQMRPSRRRIWRGVFTVWSNVTNTKSVLLYTRTGRSSWAGFSIQIYPRLINLVYQCCAMCIILFCTWVLIIEVIFFVFVAWTKTLKIQLHHASQEITLFASILVIKILRITPIDTSSTREDVDVRG